MSSLDRRNFLSSSAVAVAGLSAAPRAEGAAGPAPPARPAVPRFRLGLVTYNLAATWGLGDVLKACRTAGISPVEFRTTHGHGVEPALTKVQRQDVRKRCADAGVAIWGSGTACEFQMPDAAEVKRQIETCRRFIELVADLGGRGVKVRPNSLPAGVPVERTLAQIGKALIPCGQAAADAGVEIWVEVHGRGTAHPPHMKTIMEQCGHRAVGVTWNSNPTDIKDGSIAEYFRLLRPWIKSVHINELYRDAAGTYPYRELFRLLRESDYDRATLIEVGHRCPDVGTGIEVLRYYKALWQELCRA